MATGKLRIPYRQRILHYCETHGVVVPHGFDAPKSSDKFAAIDITDDPPQLVKYTTFLEREVIEFIQRPENTGRQFRILDFKNGLELACYNESKLSVIGRFDCNAPGELLSLVRPDTAP